MIWARVQYFSPCLPFLTMCSSSHNLLYFSQCLIIITKGQPKQLLAFRWRFNRKHALNDFVANNTSQRILRKHKQPTKQWPGKATKTNGKTKQHGVNGPVVS